MKCLFCGYGDSKVIDSRNADGGSIRRRRECLKCQKRFTTYEKVETIPLMVVKKDNTRQEFSREKLMRGLLHACRKRPVSSGELDKIVDDVENMMVNSMQREVSVRKIGNFVMKKLKDLDQVAYVRFVSVYKDFKDVDSFITELEKLKSENAE